MTNHKSDPDHKILGSTFLSLGDALSENPLARRSSEGGYTTVSLLAFMTLLAIFAMAAAPRLQQQMMREREKEAIFRGEQIADAIAAYYVYRRSTTGVVGDQALPSSMDQLLQGIPIQSAAKNRMILRSSAAIDPLSSDGEWRFIAPRGEALVQFQQSVMLYAGNVLPTPSNPQILQLQQFAAPPVIAITNLGVSTNRPSRSTAGDTTGGPFVAVAPNSTRKSVLTYYGIESHDQWIFTPLFRR